MGKIVVSDNVSLDGVVQDPDGGEGFRAGGWVGRAGHGGRVAAAAARSAEVGKILLDEVVAGAISLRSHAGTQPLHRSDQRTPVSYPRDPHPPNTTSRAITQTT